MSHYAEYIKETLDTEIIEDNRGFATYSFLPEGCYIKDIYVHPDYRKDNVASEYADRIKSLAKSLGHTTLIGSVNTQIKDPTTSMKVLLAYGMKFHSISGILIFYTMEIT